MKNFFEMMFLIIIRVKRIFKGRCSGKISIIIATYNRGRILCERTIPSILSQSYQNFEIIIIGDCVSDDTSDRLLKINDKRITFKNFTKRSTYPSDPINKWMVAGARPRNAALKLAKGGWIYTISDDDILLNDCLQVMINFANESKFESISADYIGYVNGDEKVMGINEVQASSGIEMTGIPSWMYMSDLKFFKWNENSWKNKWNKPSDYDLQHRMKNAGVRMGYVPIIVAKSPLVEGTLLTGSQAAKLLHQNGNY